MKREYNITKALLTPNTYSRPQSLMKGIKGICIHWVANPNSTAINNRNYFNNLRNQTVIPKRYASSHEIIGLEGEVIICIPPNEVAFHAGATTYKPRVKTLLNNSPNRHLYGIETCHPDWGGKFRYKTYKTLINRTADLLIEFNLKPSKDTIWRHYDVTGKDCPKYYMQNEGEWNKLIKDVTENYLKKVRGDRMDLQEWQKELGSKAIDILSKRKIEGESIINNPEEWKKTLGEDMKQWTFWTIIERITRGNNK